MIGGAISLGGSPGKGIKAIIYRTLQATVLRYAKSTSALRKMNEFFPAMVLIGALIALMQVLGNLDDPSTVAQRIAIALLTTFYSATLANMAFMSPENELEPNSHKKAMVNYLYELAFFSIDNQENPRRHELIMNSTLPPAKRVRYFD